MSFYQYELYKKALDLKFNESLLIHRIQKAEFYYEKSENIRKQNLIKKRRKIIARQRRKRKRIPSLKLQPILRKKEKKHEKKDIFMGHTFFVAVKEYLCGS